MSNNTYKMPGKTTTHSGSLFKLIDRFLRIDESLAQVIHVRFLPQILFASALCVIYIGNRHYAEKKIRAISTLETEVEDLRADYTTLKAEYKFASKQSEVARQAKALGLEEGKHPPFKIIVNTE